MSGFEDVTIPYWKWTEPFPSHLDDDAGDNNFMGAEELGFFFQAMVFCSAPAASEGKACSDDADCDTSPGNGVCDRVWTTRLGGDALQARSDASAVGEISQSEIQAALSKDPYDEPKGDLPDGWLHSGSVSSDEFRPYWEALHDRMHCWVGGDLGNPPTAAEDPVFWLAHAYFDCMWAEWESTHDPDYRPDTASFPDDYPTPPGEDADDVMGPWNEHKIRDVLETEDLGYVYQPPHDKTIPAVSEWGLIVLTLLLLIGINTKFRPSGLSAHSENPTQRLMPPGTKRNR